MEKSPPKIKKCPKCPHVIGTFRPEDHFPDPESPSSEISNKVASEEVPQNKEGSSTTTTPENNIDQEPKFSPSPAYADSTSRQSNRPEYFQAVHDSGEEEPNSDTQEHNSRDSRSSSPAGLLSCPSCLEVHPKPPKSETTKTAPSRSEEGGESSKTAEDKEVLGGEETKLEEDHAIEWKVCSQCEEEMTEGIREPYRDPFTTISNLHGELDDGKRESWKGSIESQETIRLPDHPYEGEMPSKTLNTVVGREEE